MKNNVFEMMKKILKSITWNLWTAALLIWIKVIQKKVRTFPTVTFLEFSVLALDKEVC
jgi:hypothetical protein